MVTKAELIDKYRYINVDLDDWHEYIIEGFIERMSALGIPLDIEDILFSGFCCQGDGASFTCYIDGDDFDTFARIHDLYTDDPVIAAAYRAGCDPYIKVRRNGHHYCHENTVSAEFGVEYEFCNLAAYEGNDFMEVIAEQMDTKLYHLDIDGHITEILRGYMRELHSELWEAYDADTSDEAVWEAIQNNNLDEELEDEAA